MVENRLGAKIDRLAVSYNHIFTPKLPLKITFQENINGTYTYAASCQEYFDLGNRENGKFKIRPNATLHAFEVECEFDENGGSTVMKPKQWNEDGFIFPPTEDKRCSEANCFAHSFEYFASDEQIQVRHHMIHMI